MTASPTYNSEPNEYAKFAIDNKTSFHWNYGYFKSVSSNPWYKIELQYEILLKGIIIHMVHVGGSDAAWTFSNIFVRAGTDKENKTSNEGIITANTDCANYTDTPKLNNSGANYNLTCKETIKADVITIQKYNDSEKAILQFDEILVFGRSKFVPLLFNVATFQTFSTNDLMYNDLIINYFPTEVGKTTLQPTTTAVQTSTAMSSG